MGAISIWLLSIVGVILITVMVEIIIPEGQMNKYIKGVLSIITVFVVVLPLPYLSVDKLDFGRFFNSSVDVDDRFIENLNRQKILEYENIIERTLAQNGFNGASVEVLGDLTKPNMKIDTVNVNLALLVLSDPQLNINRNEKIEAIILAVVDIKKENINLYG
ncbi:MAG: stage III sporulation protein AF [Christensenellaceae bacterium]|nr:stage III sporulation protein AF [Christensenellaceae bacterium]